MIKGERVPNRSDHEAACPQVFKETPKPVKAAAAPKKSKKKVDVEEVVAEEVVAEEVVDAEIIEDADSDDSDDSDGDDGDEF